MCVWLRGAARHVIVTGALWVVLFLLVTGGQTWLHGHASTPVLLTIGRWTLFLTLLLQVVVERDHTLNLVNALRPVDEGDAPIGETTRWLTGCLAFPFFAVWFAIVEPLIEGAIAGVEPTQPPRAQVFLAAWAWSMLVGGVFALMRGGLALMWASATSRLAAPAELPAVQPLFLTAWVSLLLVPTLLGQLGVLLGAVLLMTIPAALMWAAQQGGPEVELLITLKPGNTVIDTVPASILHGAEATERIGRQPTGGGETWVFDVPVLRAPSFIQALQNEGIERIEVNSAVSFEPRRPGRTCTPDAGVMMRGTARVAVVDTGVNSQHPGLLRRILTQSIDRHGHGTAMAGIAVVVGTGVQVWSFPALAGPRPAADDVATAIHEAIDAKVDVINLSFSGAGTPPTVVVDAINAAHAAGIAVIAAAGNHGDITEPTPWPASIPGVLAVISMDASGRDSPFSKTAPGAMMRVRATGEDVCAPDLSGGWSTTSGTSAAAALVSGMVATASAECNESPIRVVHRLAGTVGIQSARSLSCR